MLMRKILKKFQSAKRRGITGNIDHMGLEIAMRTYEQTRADLAKNLKVLMRKRRWTQDKLAAKSGVAQGTIRSILHCERQTGIYILWAIASALDVDITELMKGN